MKIEVNVNAPEIVSALNNLANAMGSTPVAEAPKNEPEKTEKTEDIKEPETFKKASYFYHPESSSYLAFKKGDVIPTDADFQLANAIPKKEYDKGIANQKKAETKEESEEAPTIEVVRAKTAEASKAGKKADVKDLLSEMGVNAISKIPEDQRAEYLEKLEAL